MIIKNHRSFICGVKGKVLSKKEIEFLKKYKPWGVILFQRNIGSIKQTINLTNYCTIASMKTSTGGRPAVFFRFLKILSARSKIFSKIFCQNHKEIEEIFNKGVKNVKIFAPAAG